MRIIHLEETESTNEYVKNNIRNLADNTVVYADKQTKGKGRLGRKWVDTGKENLYMTLVLKPFSVMNPIYANFTQYLSVILSMVLEEEYNLKCEIKWPNDVLVNGKKIAGILSECTTQGVEFLGLALGIGVNLNTEQKVLDKIDKPAASVFTQTGIYVDRDVFLKKLLTKFFLYYDRFKDEGFLSVKSAYTSRAVFLGRNISINVLGQVHKGMADEITDNGSLGLIENNQKNIYFIGDIL